MKFLYIALFGLAGVFARYLAGLWLPKWLPEPFPTSTFAVNLAGCFLIGVVYVLGSHRLSAGVQDLWLGVVVGFLGGFTTFSSYGLDTFKLFEDGQDLKALAYFSLTPVLGLACTFLGAHLTRALAKLVP
jgi:CrcB protein